jgi:quercetin dioxygenase-like cupin family protein
VLTATAAREQVWFLDTLVTVHVGRQEGADGLSVLESFAAHGDSPPLHVHRTEDEVFHVLEGELRLRIGERDALLGRGQTVLAPKGAPHTYRVESERARWLTVTAHGDFENFVRALGRPATSDELPAPSGPPAPEQAQALAAEAGRHGIDIVGPPLA